MAEIRRKPVSSVTSRQIEHSQATEDQFTSKEVPPRYHGNSGDLFGNAMPNANQPDTHGRKHNVLRNWIWELISAVFCIGIVTAIVAVLARFDGKELPEWPLHINLNAAISILADVLKAALLLIAGAIISQSKWVWFSDRARPLNHLQRFEEASRSVMGSAALLFTAPSHFPTLFATILTILAIAVGPFTQQAVQTRDCMQNVTLDSAYLPVAQYFGANQPGVTVATVNPEVYVAVINGLVNPQGNDSQIAAVCPTGNCTFPTDSTGASHTSMGMCRVCIDTTSLVEYTTPLENYPVFNLPNTTTVSATTPMTVSDALNIDSWAATVLTDEARAAFAVSLCNLTVLTKTDERPVMFTKPDFNVTKDLTVAGVVAATCGFYPCLKRYHAQVNKGILTEKVVSTTIANKMSFDKGAGGMDQARNPSYLVGNYTAMDYTCVLDGKVYTMANISDVPQKPGRHYSVWKEGGKTVTAPTDCLYLYSGDYQAASSLAVYLAGDCLGDEEHARLGDGELQCTAHTPDNNGTLTEGTQSFWWLVPLFHKGTATFDSLNKAMEDVATVFTNNMRVTGTSPTNRFEHQHAYGIVQKSSTCTRFEWRWLIFPIALTFVAVLLLVWGIVASHWDQGRPVWKNSLLPLLFYGLEGQRSQRERAAPMQDLDEQARGTMVWLRLDDNTTRFVDQGGSKGDDDGA